MNTLIPLIKPYLGLQAFVIVFVIVLALALGLFTPLPSEFSQLDQFIYELGGGEGLRINSRLFRKSPQWYSVVSQLLWILLLAFLAIVLPNHNAAVSVLMMMALVLLLVVVQMIGQTLFKVWLPQGVVIKFVVFTGTLVIVCCHFSLRWKEMVAERDDALIELANLNMQQGQLEQAFERLKQCEPSEQVQALAYDLALQQESKRSFSAAGSTYEWLNTIAPQYKDVAERVETLRSPDSTVFDPLADTQTLAILTDKQRNPVLGRYRIERELGRGAMGVVYLGVDPKISRKVAIKTLSYKLFPEKELDEVKERFFREAEAAGRLTHPNIVTIYDVGEEQDLSFIAMDYIQGKSLANYINADELLPVKTVYRLIAQVADALDYAHQQRIIHRDIKPGNLLYNANENQMKVADFGIARITDNSCTKTGDILGSPLYMSPEQLKGDRVTGSTDIYSLGVTFYQLLTGAFPFHSDSIASLAYQILHKKFKSVREIRPQLPVSAVLIVNKAMAKDHTKRFANAGAMARSLRIALRKDFGVV